MHCYVENFYQIFLHLRLATAWAAIFFAQIFLSTWAASVRSCRPTSVGSSREEFPGRGSHCPDQSGKRSRESWIIASESTVSWIRMRLIDLNDDLLPINWIVWPIHGWLPSKSLQRARESRILHRRAPRVGLEWGWDRGPDLTHAPLLAPGLLFDLNQPRRLSLQYVQYAQSQCKCILAQVNSLEYVIKMEMLLKQIQYCERDEPIKVHPSWEEGGGLTLNDKSLKFKGFLILP